MIGENPDGAHNPEAPANKQRKLARSPGFVNYPDSSPSPVVDYFLFALDSGGMMMGIFLTSSQ